MCTQVKGLYFSLLALIAVSALKELYLQGHLCVLCMPLSLPTSPPQAHPPSILAKRRSTQKANPPPAPAQIASAARRTKTQTGTSCGELPVPSWEKTWRR